MRGRMREERSCQVREAAGVARISGNQVKQAAPDREVSGGPRYDSLFDSGQPQALGEEGRGGHQEVLRREERVIECAVCRRPHIARSRRSRTCSPECAEIYPKVRYHLDEEARHLHRVSQAKVILSSPGRYRESQIVWAKRMLSESPPPPNRSFTKKGSSVERLLRKVDRVRRSVARDLKREQP